MPHPKGNKQTTEKSEKSCLGGEMKDISQFQKRRCVCMKKLLRAVSKAIAESCEAWYWTYRA